MRFVTLWTIQPASLNQWCFKGLDLATEEFNTGEHVNRASSISTVFKFLVRPGYALICVLVAGCTHYPAARSRTPTPENSSFERDYIDLKAGWRLRVVFPLLRSGGYIAVNKEPSEGSDVKVSSDFLGYEKDYYRIKASEDQRIKIDFIKTEVWENGKLHSRPRTSLPLFNAIGNSSYVRLVYLVRASQADHNMALVAASDTATLDAITRSVTSSAICESGSGGVCNWIPAGVAVTPEEKLRVNGKGQWLPAR